MKNYIIENIKDYNIEWYRHQIGYVEQEPPVLSGNIEENITYGVKEYTEEEFKEVCHLSGVNEFATNRDIFPDGYKTLVGERGINIIKNIVKWLYQLKYPEKQRVSVPLINMLSCSE